MVRYKFSCRLLSVITAVLLLFGTLSVAIVSAAPAVTPKDGVTAMLESLTEDEVAQMKPENPITAIAFSTTAQTPANANRVHYHDAGYLKNTLKPLLVDGKTSDGKYGNDNNSGGGAALERVSGDRIRIHLYFGGKKDISRFLISWAAEAPAKTYSIYASTASVAGAFSSKPLVTVTEDGEGACNRLITLNNPVSATYIGIEFTDLTTVVDYDNTEWVGVLLTELGVYKEEVFTEMDITDSEIIERHSENLIAGLKPTVYGTPFYTTLSKPYPRKPEMLTDGKSGRTAYSHDTDGDGVLYGNRPVGEDDFGIVRFTYTLGEVKEIQSFMLSWTDFAPATEYKIYVSDNRATIFDSEPIVERTNEPAETFNRLITLSESVSGRYVGFEFYAKKKEGNFYDVCLMELAAYGTETPAPDYTVDETLDTSAVSEDNLIAVASGSATNGSSFEDIAYLYDRNADNEYSFSVKRGRTAQFVLQLDDIYWLDSVLVALADSSKKAEYMIFTGLENSNLFTVENYRASRKYTEGGGAVSLVKPGEKQLTRYIGIRFTSVGDQNEVGNILKIIELGALGEKADIQFDISDNIGDTLLNADYVAQNADKNLLDSGDVNSYITVGNGYALQSTGEVDFPRSLDMLFDGLVQGDTFDGTAEGGALKFLKNSDNIFRLTLDLGYFDCSFDSLLLYGLEGREIVGYNIYLADSADGLYDIENWVGFFENKNSSFVQLLKFKQKRGEQFIGIEITDNGADASAVYLKEIGIYGTRDLSKKPASVYEYDVKEDIVNQEYVTENHKYNLIRYARSTNTFDDGDPYTVKSFGSPVTDGTVYDNTAYTWWSTTDFKVCRATYSLGQTVPIDRIMFASNYNSETNYSTFIYEIYISTSPDDLYTPEHLAVYWNNYGKWKAGGNKSKGITYGASQVFEFKDRPIGRYIGFRIIKPNDAVEDNSIRIEQLGVYSNGVMPVDPLYSAVLTDEKTGVKVAIRKLEYEDEYNDVKSVSLVPYTLPNETVSAAEYYYLKSAGTAYSIILKNSAGKAVETEDLGGRSIEFTIPYKHSDSDGKLYVCQMDGGEITRLEAIVNEDSVNFITYSLNPIGFFLDTFGHGNAAADSFEWDLVYELSLKAAENNDDTGGEYAAADGDYYFSEPEEPEQNSGSDGTPTRVAKTVRKKRTVVVANQSVFTTVWFWIAVAAAVLAAAVTVTFIILKRKKRKNNA